MSEIFVRNTGSADMKAINAQCIPTAEHNGLIPYDWIDNSGPYMKGGGDGYVCPEDVFFSFARELKKYGVEQYATLKGVPVDDISSLISVSRQIAANYTNLHGRLLYHMDWLGTIWASAAKENSWSVDQITSVVMVFQRSAEMAIQDIMIKEADALDEIYEMFDARLHDPECFDYLIEEYDELNDTHVHFVGILESSGAFFSKADDFQPLKRSQGVHVTNRPIVIK